MSGKRINQVNELIHKEVAQFLLREIEFNKNCLVTVTRVESSQDLKHAKIWLSVLPISYQINVMKLIKKNIYHLQKFLDRKLVMRFVPKVSFKIDHSGEAADQIERLLDKIKKES